MKRDKAELENYLNDLFLKKKHPGVAVSVRGPEGVLFEKGFGYRNAEGDKPVDPDTVFGIASMSKSMTALACAILHAEKKLDLGDPMVKYFPNLHIPGAPDECVTLRTIAMHRAGLPPLPPLEWSIAMNSVERDSEWFRHMKKTAPNKMDKIEQIVDYITKGDYQVLGAPGEYMSYSNDGYALLSYVVDQAAGISLEEFLDERVFKPLGMTRTVLDLDAGEARKIAGENMTSLFERDEETGELICDDNWSVLPPFRGCACVKSTASDMTRYYKMLSDKGRWEGKQVIPEEAIEEMVGSRFPLSEKPFYCLGLEKSLMSGTIMCDHSGGLHGVSSRGGFLAGGYSAAVLCNEGDVSMEEFLWACWNFILGLPLETRHKWAVPSGKTFSMEEALFGDFLAEEGLPAHLIVHSEDGKLKGDYCGRKVDLLYCNETVFRAVASDDPNTDVSIFEFYIRDGKAWAVRCGNRMYQRVE
ncbi:MAG: serine hydrolase domain-containing protein [Anaerovoracaceae bacterium]